MWYSVRFELSALRDVKIIVSDAEARPWYVNNGNTLVGYSNKSVTEALRKACENFAKAQAEDLLVNPWMWWQILNGYDGSTRLAIYGSQFNTLVNALVNDRFAVGNAIYQYLLTSTSGENDTAIDRAMFLRHALVLQHLVNFDEIPREYSWDKLSENSALIDTEWYKLMLDPKILDIDIDEFYTAIHCVMDWWRTSCAVSEATRKMEISDFFNGKLTY